jgi:hypothetical protein
MTEDENEIVVTLAAEIAARVQPMELVLHPVTAFQLAGLIQLALRQSDLSDELLDAGARFVHAVREYFADCPMVLDVIRRGDDPTEDL